MSRQRNPIQRSPIKPTPKARRAPSLRAECDGLVRELVLRRDGNCCLRCGKTDKLQAAHILSKGHYQRIRFELLNVLSLCVGCHIYGAHRDPADFVEWLEEKYPGRIQLLRELAATAAKVDLKELAIGLRLEVAAISLDKIHA
jgi:hypothetical protein